MGGSNSVEIHGLRVFKVSPGSPAAEAGLEVFFDFISELNGTKMDPSGQGQFANIISAAENGSAKLQVFNTRLNAVREVIVNPRKWGGSGLLGATVRYDVVDPADNHGMRVLEVFPNSPAAHAGLMPFQDYLLGTPQSVFHDIDELAEHLNTNVNKRLQVYVYNSTYEQIREVTVVPNNDWGGDGCIGCDIGTGLLHRIPAPRNSSSRQLGGTQQLFGAGASQLPAVPAPVPMQAPNAAPPPVYAPQAPYAVPTVQTAYAPQVAFAAPPLVQPVAPPQTIVSATMQPVLAPGLYQTAPLGTFPGTMQPALAPGLYQTTPFATPGSTPAPMPTSVDISPANSGTLPVPESIPLQPYGAVYHVLPEAVPLQPPISLVPNAIPTYTSTVPNYMPSNEPVSYPTPVPSHTSTAPSDAVQALAPVAPTLPTPPAVYPLIPTPVVPSPAVFAPGLPAHEMPRVGSGLSPSDELAALQARIQQLGASMAVPVPTAPTTTTSVA